MPNWKKVIVSGSDAALNSLDVAGGITGSDVTIDDWGSISASLASIESGASSSNQNLQQVTDQGNTTTNDIFVGSSVRVGNGTSSISGSTNTVVGSASFENNTSGYRNTAIGGRSLEENTTGYNNTAVGYLALNGVETGYSNVAIGRFAMTNAATNANTNTAVGDQAFDAGYGNGNTVIGQSAFSGAQLASYNNVMVGQGAGSDDRNGSQNYQNNNSIFIGAGASSFTQSAVSNEIVIGYNAIGKGANTVVIGNSNITNNYFSGDISSSDAYIDDWGSVSASLADIAGGSAVGTLQQVTDNGSTTTNNITITGSLKVAATGFETQFAHLQGNSLDLGKSGSTDTYLKLNGQNGFLKIGPQGSTIDIYTDEDFINVFTSGSNTSYINSYNLNGPAGQTGAYIGQSLQLINSYGGSGSSATFNLKHRAVGRIGPAGGSSVQYEYLTVQGANYNQNDDVEVNLFGDVVKMSTTTGSFGDNPRVEIKQLGTEVFGNLTVDGTGITGMDGSINASGAITGSDVTIDGWGSVSASLANINASSSTQNLQQVTDNGATTTNDLFFKGTVQVGQIETTGSTFGQDVLVINGNHQHENTSILLIGSASIDIDAPRAELSVVTADNSLRLNHQVSGSSYTVLKSNDDGAVTLTSRDQNVSTFIEAGGSELEVNNSYINLTTSGSVGDVSVGGGLSVSLSITSSDSYIDDWGSISSSLESISSTLGNGTISGRPLGADLENLGVDNITLKLDSGTTYNGSTALTISAKTGSVASGSTALATGDQIVSYVSSITTGLDLQDVTDVGATTSNAITASSFVVSSSTDSANVVLDVIKDTISNGASNTVLTSWASTYAESVTIDYVTFDAGKSNKRAGTIRATWNNSTVVFDETSTSDIGNTSALTLDLNNTTGTIQLRGSNSTGQSMTVIANLRFLQVG